MFINCPFDDGFKPIFRAIAFTALSAGFHPRCALDSTDGAEVRVSKIAATIGNCDWGIHDLSRVQVGATGLPRFNMPMELGLHLGARLFGKGRHRRKRALILESEPNRYDVILSDISGQDIAAHADDPVRAIRCVRNWLSEHRANGQAPLAGATAIAADYELFGREVEALLAIRRLDTLGELPHSDFLFAVRDWMATRVTALH